jgi:hypothetical protein
MIDNLQVYYNWVIKVFYWVLKIQHQAIINVIGYQNNQQPIFVGY